MKILDRYILKQIIIGFVLVLASMTTLVWLTQSLRMIDMIVTKGVPVRIFLKLTVLVLPNFLQILSPLALFAVSLFTLIRMQSDKELMVMKAVGMSTIDIMKPLFGLGVVLTAIGYFMSLVLIPQSNTDMREMKWQIKNDLSHLLLQERQFNSFDNGLTLYVKNRLPDGGVEGVMAYDNGNPEKVSILSAQKGAVFQETDSIRVVFYDGVRQEYQPKTKNFSILKFDKYSMNFADKNDSGTRSSDVREMSLKELWLKTPEEVGGNEARWRKHKVEFVKRLTQPLYNITYLFLVIFGVLSGFYNRRGQVGRINMTVAAALVIQSLALAFENMAGKNLWFLILVVLNVFVPILFLFHFTRPKGNKLLKWFGAGLILLAVFPAGAVGLKIEKVDTKAPVDFEADQVSYNQKTNVMDATGNVILIQDGMKVKTEHIQYNKTNNKIKVPGRIDIEMSDGTVAKTNNGLLAGDLSEMSLGQTDITLYEGSSFGAGSMERKANGDAYLTDSFYTPCNRCEGKAPLWQLRAKDIHHDTTAQDIIFKHAFLDIKNLPVAYLPYWRMPDFSVKRRSGFLAPSFASTHEMRHGIAFPFFLNVSDNQNLIVTPIIAPEHIPLGLVDYNALFSKGSIRVQASATQDKEGNKNQGHIKAAFEYDATDKWRLKGQLYRASSDTYFRRYQIPDVDDTEPFLQSYLSAERFGNRNYFQMKGYSFQSLQDNVSSKTIPVFMPVFDYQYNTKPLPGIGLYGFTAINSVLYNTREHFKSNRISLTQGVELPYISPMGAVLNLKGFVRADGYTVDTGTLLISDKKENTSYTTGRIYPNVSLTVSYPLIRAGKNTTQTLEPIAMLVAAPNGGNSEDIPNVDSLVFDFDETNLFSPNRFSGYDRVEPGTRINYGIKWSRFNHKTGRSISAVFGQSFRFDNNELMTGLMGYRSHLSDYVARVQISTKYLTLQYRTRLDQKDLSAKKSEFSVSGGTNPLRLSLGYVMRKAYTIGDNFYGPREELSFSASSQLTKSWKIYGNYRYDLSNGGEPVEAGVTLQYDNECTALLFDVSKSFTQDRDYKGSTSFMFKVVLKTLGGV